MIDRGNQGAGEAFESTLHESHRSSPGAVVAADAALLAARRYEAQEEVARGGTGRILRARDVVFDRIIALKTPIDPAGASRLIAEATILAHLQHPSIMPVYDRGVFQNGMPFFAMKLVEGRSLRDVISDAPALDQRLALIPQLVGVAEAMSYAHSQGVIHRDLKPANVLVGTFGEVIVIDWGLAKLVDDDATSPANESIAQVQSLTNTSTGAVMGTPAYMAPEQARGEVVDARADVYALGAILYHVLAGSSPFAGRSGKDIIATISREGPEPIATIQPRAPVDLAAIAQKAMAFDPADRYPSARELSADLRRFQVGGLVGARRYSWFARTRRKLRQHRGKAAAIALAVASTSIAIAVMPSAEDPSARCEVSGDRIARVWSPQRGLALQTALIGAGRANAIETFERVAQRIDRYTGDWKYARTETCRATYKRGEQSEALLDLRMACLDRRLVELDSLLTTLADKPTAEIVDKAIDATGKLTPASVCGDTAALQAVVPPPANSALRAQVDALRTELARARVLDDLGRFDDGLAIARSVAAASGTLGYPPLHAEALQIRARLEDVSGDSKASEATLREALPVAAEAHDDVLAARVWNDLLYVVGFSLGRADEGNELAIGAEAAVRRAGQPLDGQVRFLTNFARVQLGQGKYADAIPNIERALATLEKSSGPDDVRLGGVLATLAWAYSAKGDLPAARTYAERALAQQERVLGPDHPLVATALNNAGEIVRQLDDLETSRAYHERALAIRERTLGPQHPSLATTLHNLAIVEVQAKQYDAARVHFERALAIREAVLGPKHPDVADTLVGLGDVRKLQGALGDARMYLERALAVQEAKLGADHPRLLYPLVNLGEVGLRQHEYEAARRDYARAYDVGKKGRGPDHPELAYALTGMAKALVGLGRGKEAHDAATQALAIREKQKEPLPLIAESRFALAQAMWMLGDRRQAIALVDEARKELVADGDSKDRIAELDAWLAEHR